MATRPTLSRQLLARPGATPAEVLLPSRASLDAPERVLQFGTGAFLRGFVDAFIDDANRRGAFNGRVVMVGSTGSGRDARLNAQDGLYTLVVQGLAGGVPHRELRVSGGVSRALSAADEWDAVLRTAESRDMSLVVSNTTEVGIVLDERDAAGGPAQSPPSSFPGKLTQWLHHRARHFSWDRGAAPVILPCELLEDNGRLLREAVLALATRWRLEPEFVAWLDAVSFCNTLVDRIVPGAPSGAQRDAISSELGYDDDMVTVCEPYRLFAIEGDAALEARLGFASGSEGILVTPDIRPFRERKVRILNGAHTTLVPLALLAGCVTVREAVAHPALGAFLRAALFDEIVPASGGVPGASDFAREVLDRFANPWLDHQLWDITLQGAAKLRVRVVPSIVDHARRTGETPRALALGFAGYLVLQCGDLQAGRASVGLPVPADDAGAAVRDAWRGVAHDDDSLARLVADVCGNAGLWGHDLTSIPAFVEEVTAHVARIRRDGPVAAVSALVGVMS